MTKLVRCPTCGGFFKPPKQAPFFPCSICKERRLTERFRPVTLAEVAQDNEPELPDWPEPTHQVVAVYSLIEHIVFSGSSGECQEFMANSQNATDLAVAGYEWWYFAPVSVPRRKAETLYPAKHSRTPTGKFRTKYPPHYPKARPKDSAKVAEYQPYEVAGLRWVWE